MSGVFVVVRSVWADWADHPYYQEEDAEDALARGYWTSQEQARAWIDAVVDRELDHERDTWRNTVAADEAQHVLRNRRARERQREYDAVEAAGLEPSFSRPSMTGPFEPRPFDEEKMRLRIRQRENYEIVELEAHS